MTKPQQTSAYKQVDVFTSVPFFGNALGVILDAEHLEASDMQRIAAWMNLSETAFVLPPTQAGADYRVRIFTPRSELGFDPKHSDLATIVRTAWAWHCRMHPRRN